MHHLSFLGVDSYRLSLDCFSLLLLLLPYFIIILIIIIS